MITYLRSCPIARLTATLSALALLLVQCSIGPQATPVVTAPSPDELFDGMFLFKGDVANRISVYAPLMDEIATLERDPVVAGQFETLRKDIKSRFFAAHPEFAAKFHEAYISRDIQQIEAEYSLGAAAMKDLVEASNLVSSQESAGRYEKVKALASQYDLSTEIGMQSFLQASMDLSARDSGGGPQNGVAFALVIVILVAFVLVVAYVDIYEPECEEGCPTRTIPESAIAELLTLE